MVDGEQSQYKPQYLGAIGRAPNSCDRGKVDAVRLRSCISEYLTLRTPGPNEAARKPNRAQFIKQHLKFVQINRTARNALQLACSRTGRQRIAAEIVPVGACLCRNAGMISRNAASIASGLGCAFLADANTESRLMRFCLQLARKSSIQSA